MTIREMMAMYHSLQFVEELLDYIEQYPDDDYMTMECLCRKLVKYKLMRKVDGYYQTHDIHTNTHECVKNTHDKTENCSEKPNNSTISKMEQVDKDINVRSKDEPQNYCDDCLYTDTCDSKEFFYACTSKATISKMEQVKGEQTERSE